MKIMKITSFEPKELIDKAINTNVQIILKNNI